MYPDGTNRDYTIKKMFNRSNAENAENSETECFFSRQSLPSLPLFVCVRPRYSPLCAVAAFPPRCFPV
nr:unnamed protein product [Callosobruchus analis]